MDVTDSVEKMVANLGRDFNEFVGYPIEFLRDQYRLTIGEPGKGRRPKLGTSRTSTSSRQFT